MIQEQITQTVKNNTETLKRSTTPNETMKTNQKPSLVQLHKLQQAYQATRNLYNETCTRIK